VYGAWNDKTGPRGTLQAGSVAKLVTAVAAAREGRLPYEGEGCRIESTTTFDCVERDRQGPSFTLPEWKKPIHDHAKDKTHGTIDVVDALAVSCNVYFGQLGLALGPDPYRQVVADGLQVGWSPRFEPGAAGTRTLASTAFGQGTAAMSPLQAARLVAMIGADGVYRECPSDLGAGVECAETRIAAPGSLTPVVAGLSAVMTRGTGRGLVAPEGVRVYGKTGTADQLGLESEVPFGVEEGKYGPPHSWFVALAERADQPEGGAGSRGRLAVAVVIARGGSGRGAAAPAAMDILKAAHELGYFEVALTTGIRSGDPPPSGVSRPRALGSPSPDRLGTPAPSPASLAGDVAVGR
jgi:peptidoglycan glycosyltransferase